MPKILLLEDDADTAKPVSDWLVSKRHLVEHCLTVSDAQNRLNVSHFDLLIIDWNLPDGSGIELLRELRSRGNHTPALVLTAKSGIDDKETAFTSGSDDYLTKPFNLKELGLRVDALLRRPVQLIGSVLTVGDLTLDPESYAVTRGGDDITLLPKEFALLEFFLRHPNQVFSAEAILQRVWVSESEVTTFTVTTTIKRLRRKIDRSGEASAIQTVFGVGYKLLAPRDK